MGRLAGILGSNALGPGGEEVAAAAAEPGAAIVQRHGPADAPYVLPHQIDHAANLRPLAEQGCDRVLAIGPVGSPPTPSCRSAACSAPTTSSPSTSGPRSSPTPAPIRPRASTRAGAPKSSRPGRREGRRRATAASTGRRWGPASRPPPRGGWAPPTPTWSG